MVEVRNFEFMFYGFLAAWLIVMLYVVSIAARERKLRREIDRVKRLLEQREEERAQERESGRRQGAPNAVLPIMRSCPDSRK